eukprot:CAMPEP_0178983662 /NCGR_PEP_ID=MMETSP0795-20121207/1181_1 /TAXON_ID=88552 /ORGANISM="Amoebophrya sp., Strain Ameob2" /LENGTH=1173 /DNA_ID=CAMNT_0020674453 /DNA_START=339 /DNA_END=3861 /DNA_ORIENTATION=-
MSAANLQLSTAADASDARQVAERFAGVNNVCVWAGDRLSDMNDEVVVAEEVAATTKSKGAIATDSDSCPNDVAVHRSGQETKAVELQKEGIQKLVEVESVHEADAEAATSSGAASSACSSASAASSSEERENETSYTMLLRSPTHDLLKTGGVTLPADLLTVEDIIAQKQRQKKQQQAEERGQLETFELFSLAHSPDGQSWVLLQSLRGKEDELALAKSERTALDLRVAELSKKLKEHEDTLAHKEREWATTFKQLREVVAIQAASLKRHSEQQAAAMHHAAAVRQMAATYWGAANVPPQMSAAATPFGSWTAASTPSPFANPAPTAAGGVAAAGAATGASPAKSSTAAKLSEPEAGPPGIGAGQGAESVPPEPGFQPKVIRVGVDEGSSSSGKQTIPKAQSRARAEEQDDPASSSSSSGPPTRAGGLSAVGATPLMLSELPKGSAGAGVKSVAQLSEEKLAAARRAASSASASSKYGKAGSPNDAIRKSGGGGGEGGAGAESYKNKSVHHSRQFDASKAAKVECFSSGATPSGTGADAEQTARGGRVLKKDGSPPDPVVAARQFSGHNTGRDFTSLHSKVDELMNLWRADGRAVAGAADRPDNSCDAPATSSARPRGAPASTRAAPSSPGVDTEKREYFTQDDEAASAERQLFELLQDLPDWLSKVDVSTRDAKAPKLASELAATLELLLKKPDASPVAADKSRAGGNYNQHAGLVSGSDGAGKHRNSGAVVEGEAERKGQVQQQEHNGKGAHSAAKGKGSSGSVGRKNGPASTNGSGNNHYQPHAAGGKGALYGAPPRGDGQSYHAGGGRGSYRRDRDTDINSGTLNPRPSAKGSGNKRFTTTNTLDYARGYEKGGEHFFSAPPVHVRPPSASTGFDSGAGTSAPAGSAGPMIRGKLQDWSSGAEYRRASGSASANKANAPAASPFMFYAEPLQTQSSGTELTAAVPAGTPAPPSQTTYFPPTSAAPEHLSFPPSSREAFNSMYAAAAASAGGAPWPPYGDLRAPRPLPAADVQLRHLAAAAAAAGQHPGAAQLYSPFHPSHPVAASAAPSSAVFAAVRPGLKEVPRYGKTWSASSDAVATEHSSTNGTANTNSTTSSASLGSQMKSKQSSKDGSQPHGGGSRKASRTTSSVSPGGTIHYKRDYVDANSSVVSRGKPVVGQTYIFSTENFQ